MTASLAGIWHHPIKSHGREALERIGVLSSQTLPWDRTWAVLHEAAKADGSDWAQCANFSRGSKAPRLMAIDASLDEATGRVSLFHPDQATFEFDPDAPDDQIAFLDWVSGLMPPDRAASSRIVRVEGRGMTDTEFPSVSLAGMSSLRALSDRVGKPLDQRRFHINLWVEGLAPFEEFEWVGRDIEVGGVAFRVEERIERCMATTANPETGKRDADTLGALEDGWGHRDLGIYLIALSEGEIALGDSVKVRA